MNEFAIHSCEIRWIVWSNVYSRCRSLLLSSPVFAKATPKITSRDVAAGAVFGSAVASIV